MTRTFLVVIVMVLVFYGHWEVLLISLYGFIAFYIEKEEAAQRMLPLAEVLDGGHFDMDSRWRSLTWLWVGQTMHGLFQRQPIWFRHVMGMGVQKPAFHVAVSCRSAFYFIIKEKSWVDKIGKALGFLSVETGDPGLGRRLIFYCDEALRFTNWMGRPEVKEAVAFLIVAEGMSLRIAGGFLRAYYVWSRTYYVSREVEAKMQPANVRLILENLQTLAKSLEYV